jgi:7-cyano-7-deazaguanine synthase
MAGDLVLFSGGLDSTVCLALAATQATGRGDPNPTCLSFDYGQRHRVELERAKRIAAVFGSQQLIVALDTSRWGGSALTDPRLEVPDAAGAAPPGAGAGGTAAAAGPAPEIPATYVPARNISFRAVALGVAEARGLDRVHIGVNAIDYSGYPDCRPEFLQAFREVARLGQRRGVEGRPVEIVAPLVDMSKAEIVRLGTELGAPLDLTWSCYRGGAKPCGTCDACVLRARGFATAGEEDPALALDLAT